MLSSSLPATCVLLKQSCELASIFIAFKFTNNLKPEFQFSSFNFASSVAFTDFMLSSSSFLLV